MTSTLRGLRNFNPGNIRHGSKWKGLAGDQTDPDFCTFSSMPYGCRALIKLLITYRWQHRLATVRGIISRWAPTNENETDAYVESVARAIGFDADAHLPPTAAVLLKVAKAIARHECGKEAETAISTQDWKDGLALAGVTDRWA